MELEIKKNEFLNYMDWVFMGLSGDQVITINNLDNNEMFVFPWKAIVNDRDMADKMLNKIKGMINLELTLETRTTAGTLFRSCTYMNGTVVNIRKNNGEQGFVEMDLLHGWGDC